ncbi:MAG: PQQ-dependent dehydrogenase, methanol/ethanol family [Pseudomonadota bacterium]
MLRGFLLACACALAACAPQADDTVAEPAGQNALPDVEWPLYGLNAQETRFSPLDQIDTETVGDLGLHAVVDLGTRFSLQSTPTMVDGMLYFTGDFSEVMAADARTGEILWTHTPEFDRSYLRKSTYGTANRGVAVSDDRRVFVGTLNAQLQALDALTGALLWSVDTKWRDDFAYTITSAPRLIGDLVIVGNAGAEFGVRGYVTAYHQETGEMAWRFFTVPGDPALPQEHPELDMALETWSGDAFVEYGGGGTVWNSIVYDAGNDQVFIGVGNGSPLAREMRSPGGGDNLFLSSIVALDRATGRMNWYYQTTPGDTWDYTATQDMALATMEIDGEPREVVMQAPKNGFFYVLDRKTGELLRAHDFVKVTWATHIDMATGRPVENPEADFSERAAMIFPGPLGGHNWQGMSVDADNRRVFIPAIERAGIFALDPRIKAGIPIARNPNGLNLGFGLGNTSHLPEMPQSYGKLQAFDPVSGETLWEVRHDHYYNGGVLATEGGLVFQGDAFGELAAYHADTGEKLWSDRTFRSILAPPITYRLDGAQYIALLTATGGGEHYSGYVGETAVAKYGNAGQLLIYRLGGTAELAEPALLDRTIPEKPAIVATPEDIGMGAMLYAINCSTCHGAEVRSAGVYPDLRLSPADIHALYEDILLDGLLQGNGMANFADILGPDQVRQIEAYVVARAEEDKASGWKLGD